MNKNTNAYWHQLDHKYYLPVFKRLPIAFERGAGCKLYDVEGREYLDMLAGIAVNNVGHSHPHVVKAIQKQAAALMHVSNFFVTKPQMLLARKLAETSGLDRVFFTNSGAESVEGAVKVARKYSRTKGRGSNVLTLKRCFHGRTLGAIAMGKREKHKVFGPLPENFRQVEADDIKAVEQQLDESVAAVILEPVQGEGGIHVAEKEYLQQLRRLCDERDIVLIFDEIQCGMGRIGTMYAWQHFGVKPDIITLAKGLGAGYPVGAVLCREEIAQAMDFGDHGTTFGGNALACAAALASLEVLEQEMLPQKAAETGTWLMDRLEDLRKQFEYIKEVRGLGLMIGLVFDFEAKPLVGELLQQGIIANATAQNVLRLVPPLTISRPELNHFLSILEEAIPKVYETADFSASKA